jgi:hypothetical protein
MKKKQGSVVFVAVLLIGLSFLVGLICGCGDGIQQVILAVPFMVEKLVLSLLWPLFILGVVVIFMVVGSFFLGCEL